MANPSTTNPAPLRLVLLITFFGSMGTAVITNGLSFIADQGLGYSGTQNLLLALVLGAAYIPAALLSAPIQRRLTTTTPLTTRHLLLLMMLLLTAIAQVPMLAQWINPAWTEVALWTLGIGYMILVGMLWPIVEGYLSGGRSGKPLRNAIGKFNIVWSASMVLAYWLMAPLIESSPFLIIALLGSVHIFIAAVVYKLPDEPAAHLTENHQPHNPTPPVYRPLLNVFRVMLIASYIILSAIIPLMPSTQARLGLDELWWTPIASTWLIVRVLFFFLFERWHGWHGRWWTPWFGMSTMLIGFALSMGSPMLGSSATETIQETVNLLGVLTLVGGLALMGIGIAAIYYGALYYAMAVGGSDVDSGGKHEALIGVGYTAGPLCGLIGAALSTDNTLGVIGLTTLVVLTMVAIAAYKAPQSKRPPKVKAPPNPK